MSTLRRVQDATRQLRRDVAQLRFSAPVTHVYNPLEYARRPHNTYLRRFASGRKRILLLGMNPGPYGMAQTGVPFGHVETVREWLGIEERVDAPAEPHPKRPVEGFACTRSEVSGQRLWGAISGHFRTPERFFAEHFITNYCPLVFMEESGRNRTPDKLPKPERDALYAVCDRHLTRVVAALEPEWLLGIGAFAATRARAALGEGGRARIASILHPSPANPRANQGWEQHARNELQELGICVQGACS